MLCDFAAKLTLLPSEMNESDVAILRQHQFDDAQITVATQVIGYFNYINRVANGLGVDPESWMSMPEDEWHALRGRDYQ